MDRNSKIQIIYLIFCIFGERKISQVNLNLIFYILQTFEISIFKDFHISLLGELDSNELRECITNAISQGYISPLPNYKNQTVFYLANELPKVKYHNAIDSITKDSIKNMFKLIEQILNKIGTREFSKKNLTKEALKTLTKKIKDHVSAKDNSNNQDKTSNLDEAKPQKDLANVN